MNQNAKPLRKPPWIRVRLGQGKGLKRLEGIVRGRCLHTVCDEALCPNKGECWEQGRATILILGGACTRRCGFCNVTTAKPVGADRDEPRRVAEAVKEMGLNEVVLTSVTRDDLPDGGAGIWAETIRRVKEALPGGMVEVLVPDFGGDPAALQTVLEAGPHVFGHNLETVPSLYSRARPQADFERSLRVLAFARERGAIVKTGIMVGLGESSDEVLALMRRAREAGCEIFSVGQYLRPSRKHLPVSRYVEPAEFDAYRREGMGIGFRVVVAGPLVRSSFHSEEQSAFVRRRLKGEIGGV